jgi:hypothetical protein
MSYELWVMSWGEGVGVNVNICSEIIPERRKRDFHQDPPAQ